MEIGRDVAGREELASEHQRAGIAACILVQDLLPELAASAPSWKLLSWSLLLASLIPDPTASNERTERLSASLLALESDAMIGKQTRRGARKGGSAWARRYATQALQWQPLAEQIWAKNPSLSKTAVARRIAQIVGGNSNTIRRKITKS